MKTYLLHELPKGRKAVISAIDASHIRLPDMERRLLEMGMMEGAPVEVLHRGRWGRALAVRVWDYTLALRQREAQAVTVVEV